MKLPLPLSYAPMEARLVECLPEGPDWQYEPKWDGFRCLLFRDGDSVAIQSRSGQPLQRYFPEVVAHLKQLEASRFVLDAELVTVVGDHLSFDDLLQRIHPAESRIRRLSVEHPATLVVFDLLVDDRGRPLSEEPLLLRRQRLEEFAARYFDGSKNILLSPVTRDLERAAAWLAGAGDALDGVVAKRVAETYKSGERAMRKVKRIRTADCVVGGFRYASGGRGVGSLLLGLYGTDDLLHHVGFCSGFANEDRRRLVATLEPRIAPPGFTGNAPGGPSRWTRGRSVAWQPLKPELVIEVTYDHFSGGRFRHGTGFQRWRPDKTPEQCRLSQIESEAQIPPDRLLEPDSGRRTSTPPLREGAGRKRAVS